MYKHVKQVHWNDKPDNDKADDETAEFSVGCGLCYMEFTSEEACDAHVCSAKNKAKPSIKSELKIDNDNNHSNGQKRSTPSSRGSKK